ncbi:MAG: M18 family aminopeptidase [Lachnospiraceae bacterium]|nr:M18 family aminopeptidase [Lachnospiraceae bacterium]
MEEMKSINELINTVKASTCAYTTVLNAENILRNDGFEMLKLGQKWILERGGKYMINIHDSALVAFTIGKGGNLKIGCAHTDHPCIYIKPSPEMTSDSRYGKLNTEIYGGPILNTWMDRPLSIAGRVALKSEDPYNPVIRIIDMEKPVLTIPNLAIHLNREVNKGIELNRQVDMIPFAIAADEGNSVTEDFFMEFLADYLAADKTDILDYELYIYNVDEPLVSGINGDLLSSPRLDNITSVQALIKGICGDVGERGINVIALFDNEEIGSRTKQGADSGTLAMIIEKIYMALGYGRDEYLNYVSDGYMISLDVAHGHHPNRPEKSDVTCKCYLNSGIVIKRTASQSYATDCGMTAIIEQLCDKNDIPYQKYAIRSDVGAGSTLGTIAGKYLPMRSADVGVPVLAMHSARELMGARDQYALEKLIKIYFE